MKPNKHQQVSERIPKLIYHLLVHEAGVLIRIVVKAMMQAENENARMSHHDSQFSAAPDFSLEVCMTSCIERSPSHPAWWPQTREHAEQQHAKKTEGMMRWCYLKMKQKLKANEGKRGKHQRTGHVGKKRQTLVRQKRLLTKTISRKPYKTISG